MIMNKSGNDGTESEHHNHRNNNCGNHYFHMFCCAPGCNDAVKRKNHINQQYLENSLCKRELLSLWFFNIGILSFQFLMNFVYRLSLIHISEPTRRTPLYSSAASDVYKRQQQYLENSLCKRELLSLWFFNIGILSFQFLMNFVYRFVNKKHASCQHNDTCQIKSFAE